MMNISIKTYKVYYISELDYTRPHMLWTYDFHFRFYRTLDHWGHQGRDASTVAIQSWRPHLEWIRMGSGQVTAIEGEWIDPSYTSRVVNYSRQGLDGECAHAATPSDSRGLINP